MADKLFEVSWPVGRILVQAKDEESAVDTAVKFLKAPSAPKIVARKVVNPEFEEAARALDQTTS